MKMRFSHTQRPFSNEISNFSQSERDGTDTMFRNAFTPSKSSTSSCYVAPSLQFFLTNPRNAVIWRVSCAIAFVLASGMGISAQERLPTRIFEGRVTKADDQPVKNAIVEWGYFLAERVDREVVRTDADGKYRLETTKVGPDFRLGVSAPGFAPSWRDGLIPPRSDSTPPLTVNFQLTAPITLRGKVVDTEGKPIEGARVIAKSPSLGFFSSFSMPSPSYPFPGPAREATTNADGEFMIRYLPATSKEDANKGNTYEVSIKLDTGELPRGKAYEEADNIIQMNRSHLEPDEDRDGKIRGRVSDEKTELPIEKFKVVLRHTAGMREFTSKNGEFILERLYANSNVQFFVYAEGYAPFVAQPTALAGRGAFVECPMKKRASLKGIVVDPNGKPIAGAEVVLGFMENKNQSSSFYWGEFNRLVDGYMGLNFVQRVTTKDDGRFEFAMVDQQPVLAVIAPGFARQVRFLEPSDLPLDQKDLKLELQSESSISGVVILNGKPLPNADLRLALQSNWNLDFGPFKADELGRFTIPNLASGLYSLSVYQTSGNVMTSRLTEIVKLETGEGLTNVSLGNPNGKSCLRGKAAPFSMILLTPTKLDGDMAIQVTNIGTVASPEGDFEIAGLHAGTYTCRITPVSSLSGYISYGSNQEVVVSGDTVFKATDLRPE